MKIRFLGETGATTLVHGKVYDVISIEDGWYRIIDEDEDDDASGIPGYLYPPNLFEIVED
jgi:hypothetical protein